MIDDEKLQENVERMQSAATLLCDNDTAVLMIASIIMTTNIAKESKFPISVLHKMIDEFSAAWDENMPDVLRH